MSFSTAMPARKQLAKIWMTPMGGTPQQLADYIKSENAKWGPIIKQADISPAITQC